MEVQASTSQNLAIPSKWSGCSEVTGNVNNPLTDVNSGKVIGAFWNALVGMTLGETINFVVPADQHPYTTAPLAGQDLYYIVRIDNIDSPSGTTVTASGQVDVFYSLYIGCSVSSGGTTETSSTSIPPTSSSPSQDNTIPLLAGLGVIAIGLSVIGYFIIIKPRAELPQDTKIIEEKQAKKQMNQTKELLDLIQDKKESTKTKISKEKSSKPKSGTRPRRR